MRTFRQWIGFGLSAVLTAALLAGCGDYSERGGGTEISSAGSSGSMSQSAVPAEDLPQLESVEELGSLSPADFGCMVEEYPTQYGSYLLLAGDELERTVYTLTGEGEGPTIYIVGGTHGDELAGWYAGVLLQKNTLKAGTVYLVAPLNQYGAEHVQRKTKDELDLNRHFPGDPQGKDADRIAAALYADIAEKQPDLVLDLHEAVLHTDGRDNLGNSIICQDIQPIADLVLDLLLDSASGKLPLSHPLDLFGSPPAGSLNNTVTQELDIPVITVETFREEALNVRVYNQLRLAEYVLEWYNMR